VWGATRAREEEGRARELRERLEFGKRQHERVAHAVDFDRRFVMFEIDLERGGVLVRSSMGACARSVLLEHDASHIGAAAGSQAGMPLPVCRALLTFVKKPRRRHKKKARACPAGARLSVQM